MSTKRLQRFQRAADQRWGFDFDLWDEIVGPQRALPGVLEDMHNPEVDALVRRLEYIGLALSGEVGEVCNSIKKVRRHLLLGGALVDSPIANLKEETADVLAYLLKLSNLMNWDLEEAYLEKMKRNEERFGTASSEP